MLKAKGIDYRYRDYRTEPLAVAELRRLLKKLGRPARELLRKNDRAYRELGLEGDESDSRLVPLIAAHPTLLQRPIGVTEAAAVVGRPPEALLKLLS